MLFLLYVFELYLAVGLFFAVAFAFRGVDRLDPAVRDSGWGFRLLLLPGAMFFWPLLLWKWIKTARS